MRCFVKQTEHAKGKKVHNPVAHHLGARNELQEGTVYANTKQLGSDGHFLVEQEKPDPTVTTRAPTQSLEVEFGPIFVPAWGN